MFENLGETGGAKVNPLAGCFPVCGFGADRTESGQNSVPFPLPIQGSLVFSDCLNQRDSRVKMTLCRSRGDNTACGGGGDDGSRNVFAHNETNKATTVPTNKTPMFNDNVKIPL